MPETINPQSNEQDDALASFTDQLLAGDQSDEITGSEDDQKLRKLQDTTAMLWELFGQEEPDNDMRDRIYQNLVKEWEKTRVEESSESFWERLYEVLLGSAGQRMAFAAAAVLILVIVGFWFVSSPVGIELAGSAGSGGSIAFVAIGAGSLLIAVFLWLEKRDNSDR